MCVFSFVKHWKQSSGIYHLHWVGMRGVCVQVCIFVPLEVVEPGGSQQRVVIALLCVGLQLCDCQRSSSEFCVNASVAVAAEKCCCRVYLHLFLLAFALSGCVSVCPSCTVRDTGGHNL